VVAYLLFRVGLLATLTLVATVLTWLEPGDAGPPYGGYVWTGLAVGYGLTIVFAWWLRQAADLDRLTLAQTAVDVVSAAVIIQMSGGVESGFAVVYLLAILGAATMGGPRLIAVAAGASALIYAAMAVLEVAGLVVPITPAGEVTPVEPRIAAWTVLRTLAAMAGVAVLARTLEGQLATSDAEVGSLRALNANIVRSLTSGLITVDRARRIVSFNPAARDILGLEDSVIGRRASAILPGVEAFLARATPPSERSELVVELDPATVQRLAAERSGDDAAAPPQRTKVHLGLSTSPLTDPEGRQIGHLVIFQDVTRVHQLAEELRRSERLAAIGGLAASVAHEIRNPLAAIAGSAELLSSSAVLDHDDQRLLAVIRREAERLSRLVTELLAFTRPKPPELHPVDLVSSAASVVEAVGRDPASRGVTLELDAQAPVIAHVDPSQLSQVLWNLLRNAVEAAARAGEGGRVRVSVDVAGERAQIVVQDSGPGIAPELAAQVFEPFFTTKTSGTGLGLAIVQRIVMEMRGTIALGEPAGASDAAVAEPPSRGPYSLAQLQGGARDAAQPGPPLRGATFVVSFPLPAPELPGSAAAAPLPGAHAPASAEAVRPPDATLRT
jgi:two-component system sensor histidine kinase PilS (NtrC family)